MRLAPYLARWQGALRLLAAVGVGGLLQLVVGLEPMGWLAWLVPGLLLGLTLRWPGRSPRLLVALAAVVGTSVNFPSYRLLMPGLAAAAIVVAQALLSKNQFSTLHSHGSPLPLGARPGPGLDNHPF